MDETQKYQKESVADWLRKRKA